MNMKNFTSLPIAMLIALVCTSVGAEDNVTEISSQPIVKSANNVSQPAPKPVPHCQVPCGVYADQMRFEMMLEDATTIAKAIAAINEFADGLGDTPPSAKDLNQFSRWVATKEDHASKTQKVIAEYFLTQRIKESNKDYSSQLITAHKVMVAAMKCKQDANAATAETLKKAILDLYRAYEGKEPKFGHEEKD